MIISEDGAPHALAVTPDNDRRMSHQGFMTMCQRQARFML